MKTNYRKQIIEMVELIEEDRHLKYLCVLMRELIAKSIAVRQKE